MTGTVRIETTAASPDTRFYLSADERPVTAAHIAGNYTVVRCYLRAVNRGNTGSNYGGNGYQEGLVDGVPFRTINQNPFLPAGYAFNQQRWEQGPYDITVPHNADGTKTVALGMRLEYGSVNYNKTVNLTLTTLKSAPNTPTGVVGVRESDTAVTVSWSQSSPSNSQPTHNTVQRRVNGGSWSDVVTVAATTSVSFGVSANQKVEYRVRASNSAGTSAWSSVSAPVFTTPAAPTNVVAAKDAAQDINVSWTPRVAFTEHQHVVEHSTNNGGSWSSLATVAAGTSTYKHVAPNPAQSHRYRVRARNTSTGLLTSAWVTSGNVQLLAAPDKPSVPAVGQYADKGKAVTFGWTHNPIDTTPQKSYEVNYSTNGGTSWSSTGKVASAVSSRTFAANSYAGNVALTVRVRTWGQATTGGADGTGASPWSDSRTVTYKTRPTVTIGTPANASTWVEAALNVGLGFSQAEGGTFVRATIVLNDGTADVETKLSTTLAATVMDTQVQDGGTYTVTVTVLDSHGLTSDPVTSTFDVEYTIPVAAEVTVTYLPDPGWAQLDLTIPEPGEGEAAATAVTIYRTIDGAREAVYVAYPVTDTTLALLDTTPTIRGLNEYEVTTISDDGATADSAAELTTSEEYWAFLSTGPGFGQVVNFFGNLEFTANPVRSQALVQAAGRSRPIALFGEAGALQVSGSAVLLPEMGSTAQEVERLILSAGMVCYRDPSGRRMFGTVTGSISSPSSLLQKLSYTVTEAS